MSDLPVPPEDGELVADLCKLSDYLAANPLPNMKHYAMLVSRAAVRLERAGAASNREAMEALRELVGILEVAAVMPEAINKRLFIAWDDPALDRARRAIGGRDE